MIRLKHMISRAALIAAYEVERGSDRVWTGIKRRVGWIRPVIIHPYRGFGCETSFYLKGRVLENKAIGEAAPEDSIWRNMMAMYRRFTSAEIPGVRVRARFGGAEQVVVTDEEGYFDLHLQPATPVVQDRLWQEVSIELLDEVVPGQGPVRATGHVLVPPVESSFGIISDVDDTILQTGAMNLLKMIRTTILKNVHARLPFEGVAAFYRALQEGPSGHGYNPIFYVSSSPWNLYDFLITFLELQGIPVGPLMLQDLGLEPNKFIKTGHEEHKRAQIELIFDAHPDLPFILIGDSGQEDPEIYHQIVKEFPGRILAVYIRDVSGPPRNARVHALAEDISDMGVQMVLAADSETAARHAAAHGFIHPDALPDIAAEKAKDQAPEPAESR